MEQPIASAISWYSIPSISRMTMTCRCSSLMVFRRHLPLGILTGNIVPLLVPPEEPYCVMILPSRFWPELFVEYWKKGLAVRRLAHWGM